MPDPEFFDDMKSPLNIILLIIGRKDKGQGFIFLHKCLLRFLFLVYKKKDNVFNT